VGGRPLRLAAILCWSLLAPCTRSHVTEDDLIGRYTFRDGPPFEIEIMRGGILTQRIERRQLDGRWGIWELLSHDGLGDEGDRIEITGLVWSASDPQTNNRVHARLLWSLSGTILELQGEPPRRLTKEATQAR